MEKYWVYILYSASSDKTYVGYTNDLERRLWEHNNSTQLSFTSRFKPWILIHKEAYATKKEAMSQEKWFKSGVGRRKKKEILETYKSTQN